MKIKLAIGAAALSLIAYSIPAQSITECELGIQLVGDIIADPVIESTTDTAVLASAQADLSSAEAQCDGSEAGNAAAMELLSRAATALGHPF